MVLARRDRARRLLDRGGPLGALSTPSLLVCAAAPLIIPSAAIRAGSMGSPEIGKFSTARWVWAW